MPPFWASLSRCRSRWLRIVKTPTGRGTVVDSNMIRGRVTVRMDKDNAVQTFDVKDLKVIKDASIHLKPDEIKMLKELEEE